MESIIDISKGKAAYEEWRSLEEEAKDRSQWQMPRRRRSASTQKNLSERHLSNASFKRLNESKSKDTRSDIKEPAKRKSPGKSHVKALKQKRSSLRDELEKTNEVNNNECKSAAATDNNNKNKQSVPEKVLTGNCVTKSLTNKSRFKTLSTGPKVQATAGQVIFGNLKGFDWWPAKIISYHEAKKQPALGGHTWVYWFGDHKISEISLSNTVAFTEFRSKFKSNRMRGIYKHGIEEAIETFSGHCQKTDLPPVSLADTNSKEERFNAAVSWMMHGLSDDEQKALDSYVAPPHSGVSADAAKDDESSVDEGDSDDDNAYTKSATSKKRFESHIQAPTLAESVKRLFDQVEEGQRDIETICLACGDTKIASQHPLFEGGLCKECKAAFVESAYLFDEDGSQMYCTICSDGREVLMCDSAGCCRSYCGVCIDMLCGVGHTELIANMAKWICFLCSGEQVRLMNPRVDWQKKVTEIMGNDRETEYPPFALMPSVPLSKRKPIRVLALFDGIATGLQALKELDLAVDVYYASEIDEQAIMVTSVQHGSSVQGLGDVQFITEKQILDLGPFDLVIGGSPCNDLSIANPARKGLFDGSGRLFFEYFRLLMYARPDPFNPSRPFFWLFENVVGMRQEDKRAISRFLQCNPVMCDAKTISAQHRARYFWGNLPGMNRSAFPLPTDKLNLQQCLDKNCSRVAKFQKVRTITTKSNSLKQTKEQLLPVKMGEGLTSTGDYLWCTEIERLFGLPEHYTDVANMGKTQRQRLLGRAWSVPVVRHLLAPLRDYFKCN